MALLIGCVVTHALLAHLIASPWWLPDLTLVGLVLAVGQRPAQWLVASLVAALLTVLSAVRFSGQLFSAYLLCGWFVQLVGNRWDATDVRVQGVAALMASALLTFGAIWFENLWSPPLLGLALAHVAITGLCVPTVRWLLMSSFRMPT